MTHECSGFSSPVLSRFIALLNYMIAHRISQMSLEEASKKGSHRSASVFHNMSVMQSGDLTAGDFFF